MGVISENGLLSVFLFIFENSHVVNSAASLIQNKYMYFDEVPKDPGLSWFLNQIPPEHLMEVVLEFEPLFIKKWESSLSFPKMIGVAEAMYPLDSSEVYSLAQSILREYGKKCPDDPKREELSELTDYDLEKGMKMLEDMDWYRRGLYADMVRRQLGTPGLRLLER